jgi:NCAIR mutase (PurE)-related protein
VEQGKIPDVNPDQLRELLHAVASHQTSVDQAISRLKRLPFESLDFATLDHHRALRCGHPEVIFCPGKTAPQIAQIATRISASGSSVLATRASAEQLAALQTAFPQALLNAPGRCVLVNPPPPEPTGGPPHVALISAGTSDTPIAEEAAMTFRSMRTPIRRLTDVGVSGLHRLLAQLDVLQDAVAVVVIAGMEGALPSVVGGLVSCPVFAVPTSVGYGASLGGLTALLGMLNSCASNVSAVNIDNGFGAAFCASLVYQQACKHRT